MASGTEFCPSADIQITNGHLSLCEISCVKSILTRLHQPFSVHVIVSSWSRYNASHGCYGTCLQTENAIALWLEDIVIPDAGVLETVINNTAHDVLVTQVRACTFVCAADKVVCLLGLSQLISLHSSSWLLFCLFFVVSFLVGDTYSHSRVSYCQITWQSPRSHRLIGTYVVADNVF